jgi:hypothetical protein
MADHFHPASHHNGVVSGLLCIGSVGRTGTTRLSDPLYFLDSKSQSGTVLSLTAFVFYVSVLMDVLA